MAITGCLMSLKLLDYISLITTLSGKNLETPEVIA